jgi:hypothetical protein
VIGWKWFNFQYDNLHYNGILPSFFKVCVEDIFELEQASEIYSVVGKWRCAIGPNFFLLIIFARYFYTRL